ncbi:DNA cytosine methyltransferase [Bosea sp. ANAM02]|uniref:DNA cytosine methyltransferase n=1 Tax=Bosea sp. ANAM02 TaxID=2020412 RepID=UPI0015678B48|nr:DNA cytosine methyltransferase [Bosea sp. ANAM02]
MGGLIIDSFAGGGGASLGLEWSLGRSPDFAINHDDDALLMHAANHPQTVHLKENIWKVDPYAVTKGQPVFVLWASPDCRHHSKAKGGAPVSKSVRGLADVVLVWAETVAPQIILLENVEEFAQWGPLGEDGKPCPYHKGAEFARWVRHLERLGYAVEWRELRACDYGAPTIRKRLFLVARRDRKPILWPKPTHAKPTDPRVLAGELKPYRTAAEIIDWSLPCPSIFLTRAEAKAKKIQVVRPLADKTMARIARGFKRHVLDRPEPFVVSYYGEGAGGLNRSNETAEPLRTVTTENRFAVTVPYLAGVGGRMGQSGERPVDKPYHTNTTKAGTVVVTPFLSYAQQGGGNRPADGPHHTICANAKDQNQVVTGFLVPRYGERPGQEPRSRSVEVPAPVVVPKGNGGSLAACYLAQHNTDMIGHDPEKPMSTIVGKACTQAPVMGKLAYLSHHYSSNTAGGEGDPEKPLKTILASGNHHAVVTPYLSEMRGRSDARSPDEPLSTATRQATHGLITPFVSGYYSLGENERPSDVPLATVTTRDRFAHVEGYIALPPLSPEMAERARMVAAFLRDHGVWDGPGEFVTIGDFIVWDIGMRMLVPRELARAQGMPDSYDITAAGRLTETAQRHKIGNSVSPPPAEALAHANCVEALLMPDVRHRRRAPVPTWPGLPAAARQQEFLIAAE